LTTEALIWNARYRETRIVLAEAQTGGCFDGVVEAQARRYTLKIARAGRCRNCRQR
jgi:hypothetical protein